MDSSPRQISSSIMSRSTPPSPRPTSPPPGPVKLSEIHAWLKHTQASFSLPSPGLPDQDESESTQHPLLASPSPILTYTISAPTGNARRSILRRLTEYTSRYDMEETLQNMPSPFTNPLTPYTFPTAQAVQSRYNHILNLRDLFWVQQLMTEKRLGRHEHLHASFTYLSEIRGIVHRAEEAALYIQSFVESMGWWFDFEEINRRRCALLPATHPLCLIQPFLRADTRPYSQDIAAA